MIMWKDGKRYVAQRKSSLNFTGEYERCMSRWQVVLDRSRMPQGVRDYGT